MTALDTKALRAVAERGRLASPQPGLAAANRAVDAIHARNELRAAMTPDAVLALLDRLDALTAIAVAAYDWRDVASQCAVAYGGGGVAAHARAAHYRLSDALDAAVQS